VNKVETAGRKIRGRGYFGEKYGERKIRFNFVQEITASTREVMINEIFPAYIYKEDPSLNHNKVEIARLHSKQFQSIVIDKQESTLIQGEIPSLSHLLQLLKRRVTLMITPVTGIGRYST